MTKQCTVCNQIRDEIDFQTWKDKEGRTHNRTQCKNCCRYRDIKKKEERLTIERRCITCKEVKKIKEFLRWEDTENRYHKMRKCLTCYRNFNIIKFRQSRTEQRKQEEQTKQCIVCNQIKPGEEFKRWDSGRGFWQKRKKCTKCSKNSHKENMRKNRLNSSIKINNQINKTMKLIINGLQVEGEGTDLKQLFFGGVVTKKPYKKSSIVSKTINTVSLKSGPQVTDEQKREANTRLTDLFSKFTLKVLGEKVGMASASMYARMKNPQRGMTLNLYNAIMAVKIEN